MAITRFRNSSILNRGPKYNDFNAGLPSTPTIGTVTVTNATTVSLAFTASSSGGSPITSYTVLSSPSITLTVTGTSSPLTVTGTFAQNQAYTFQVRANNDNGSSAYSASSNSVTPLAKPIVTGGTLTSDATYYYRTFTANGTLGITGASLVCDYRLLAGGGGGGAGGSSETKTESSTRVGGGGGSCGAIELDNQTLTVNDYAVTIGAGGNGGTAFNGSTGSDSTFNSQTAKGGGGGGYFTGVAGTTNSSGGGGGAIVYQFGGTSTGYNGGAGAGTGNSGGNGAQTSTSARAGGGGGLSGAGANAGASAGGNGGAGENYFGLGTFRGGGGGGGAGVSTPTPTGGTGTAGGGNGGAQNTNGSAATANTGSGGGGGGGRTGGLTSNGGAGGSGILIVRYTRSQVD